MPSDYRSHKKYLLLNMINHFAPISRKKLTMLTDYRAASIGQLTKELLEDRIIVETGLFSSGHGRKRVLLDINKSYLCALAINFSGSSVTYVVAQFDGVVLLHRKQPVCVDMDFDTLRDQIFEQVRQILQQFADRRIVGIGLCDPIFEQMAFSADDAPAELFERLNEWLHEQLRKLLEKEMGVPVYSFGTASLPALAEHRFGAAVGLSHFICVELSNGIGASIYCNDRAVTGAGNLAGELGHTVIPAANSHICEPCYCGKFGCVEQTASFPYLARELKKALQSGVMTVLSRRPDPAAELTVEEIREALSQHDQLCMHYVRQIAEQIGIAIANAVNLLNPQMVILYGFMVNLGGFFLTALENAVRENVMVLSGRFEVKVSHTMENQLPLGAVAEIFSSYLRMDDNKWVYSLSKEELEEPMGSGGETEE